MLINIIRLARPIHWIKNFALFAALIFSGNLFNKTSTYLVIISFLVFSLTTSAAYIFNDIQDVKYDKFHPIKKKRPLAANQVSIFSALFIALVFSILSLIFAYQLNYLFFLMVLIYLVLQLIYSLGLKNVPIVDILIIAAGFIIRVYAGAFVINAHLSVWFMLCVISVSLFLASGKRRAELGIITKTKTTTRKSLSKYSETLLDSYVTMFGNAAWMSWALFTFFESPRASLPVWLFLAELSRTTTIDKLLMFTIPFVIFGIMRYESLIFEGRSEAPEKLLLTDISLIISILIWLSLVVLILYGGISSPGNFPTFSRIFS
ncbi:hypothetical protein A2Z22_03070 [Candidatus Woesebacteria bacterium RBG_16_34_12]|uniref:Phosphoribose diphosphate--decaprenyl-phosphate phosphoribosyltransferase n=1 Tax=Candidatus Woesebacteria bacterium RBG_16_34_12 TaxID=1802480 RepID=A0A1F7X790_9BACT|nr:MAG: hypothetical protein A2Z22_03070 [Candidatus Woesebacteria bacterium RBG_16_34_12]